MVITVGIITIMWTRLWNVRTFCQVGRVGQVSVGMLKDKLDVSVSRAQVK